MAPRQLHPTDQGDKMIKLTRRALMMGAAASGLPSLSWAESLPAIHVVEGRGCECCKQWTKYLKQNGFQVTSEERFGTLLMQHKIDLGVPIELTSCHTGSIDDYFLEGHVPASDIRRLLKERPEALGLTVPGMPYGSPGMGPEKKRNAYNVLLVRKDGTSEVFTRYPEA